MKEEEGRSVVIVKALELAKKKSQDLNAKLVEVDRDKKRAETALDEVERQGGGSVQAAPLSRGQALC